MTLAALGLQRTFGMPRAFAWRDVFSEAEIPGGEMQLRGLNVKTARGFGGVLGSSHAKSGYRPSLAALNPWARPLGRTLSTPPVSC